MKAIEEEAPPPRLSVPLALLTVTIMTLIAMAVVALLSDTFGAGRHVLDELLSFGAQSEALLLLVAIIVVLLYVLDISYWSGALGRLARRLTYLSLTVIVCVLCISLVRSLPYFPLAVFIFLMPLAGLAIRITALRSQTPANVAQTLGAAFVVAAVACLFVWLLWIAGAWTDGDNRWQSVKEEFSELAHCNETDKHGGEQPAGYTVVDGVAICTAAFLLWVSPFIVFGVLLLLGLFLVALARMLRRKGDDDPSEIRLLGAAVAVACFGMYLSVSIGGAGMQLANAAMAFFAVSLVGIVVVAGATVGWEELALRFDGYAERGKVGLRTNALLHAFAVTFGALPLAAFVALSYLNQAARKLACRCGMCKPLDDEEVDDEAALQLTVLGWSLLQTARAWEWGKVLTYVIYVCSFLWVFSYFGKVTNILFNVLVTYLAPLPFAAVIAIFVVIALVMFLIPVVPGPAVYLTSGVLLVPLGKKTFAGGAGFDPCAATDGGGGGGGGDGSSDGGGGGGDDWAFWASSAVACVLSFVLKLIAHVLQQKGIGEGLRGNVSVRAMVGPNSLQMRAARYILEQPGVTAAKASLLCGGPDWPTSVICGLLKLNCCEMLIGLTPVIVFTVPSTMLGAFMTEPGYLDVNLDAVCLLIIALVQVGMLLVFMSHMNRVIATERAQLDAYETDAEVAARDAETEAFNAVLARVGAYDDAPQRVRRLLQCGAVACIVATHALLMAAEDLFQPFAITDCLDTLGNDGAGPYAIWFLGIKPAGLLMMLLMLFGYVALKRFQRWARTRAEEAIAEGGWAAAPPLAPPASAALTPAGSGGGKGATGGDASTAAGKRPSSSRLPSSGRCSFSTPGASRSSRKGTRVAVRAGLDSGALASSMSSTNKRARPLRPVPRAAEGEAAQRVRVDPVRWHLDEAIDALDQLAYDAEPDEGRASRQRAVVLTLPPDYTGEDDEAGYADAVDRRVAPRPVARKAGARGGRRGGGAKSKKRDDGGGGGGGGGACGSGSPMQKTLCLGLGLLLIAGLVVSAAAALLLSLVR